MKMIVAIVHDEDAYFVIDFLNKAGFRATKLASTGGFLRMGNTTILIGCSDAEVEKALEIIKEHAKTRKSIAITTQPYMNSDIGYIAAAVPYEVVVGGATVFVIPVERQEKY